MKTATSGAGFAAVTFKCISQWDDGEGSTFTRTHYRLATDKEAAMAIESRHNDMLLFRGMRKDGWRVPAITVVVCK